eukprot:7386235-Prymnesium_polylepis.1
MPSFTSDTVAYLQQESTRAHPAHTARAHIQQQTAAAPRLSPRGCVRAGGRRAGFFRRPRDVSR